MTLFADAAWKDMSAAMWYFRLEARLLHAEMFDRDMTITSGRRPQRVGGSSLHGTGNAADIRVREPDGSWEMGDEEQRAYAAELGRRCGEDFDVIVEGPASLDARYQGRVPHIHGEYDPKGRHRDG